MRKQIHRVLVPMALLIALMTAVMINAHAFTTAQTHIIDNDDAQVKTSGNHSGFYCGADAIKLELGY